MHKYKVNAGTPQRTVCKNAVTPGTMSVSYTHLDVYKRQAFAQAGNVGQLDLVQALQWVREHAAEFGGNAHNVTLFGQSGGGAKIATLMAMPAAQGLFQRAWTMSGQQVTAAGPRAAKQRAQVYMDALGVSDVEALLRVPVAALVDALATRDPSQVEDAALYFGPVLDGVVLPRHPFWPDAPAPVSYTHLDVYKRQANACRLRCDINSTSGA